MLKYFLIYKQKLIYTGTGQNKDTSRGRLGMVMGNYDLNKNTLELNELYQNFNIGTTCEKNWVFIDYKNEVHMIYSWYPLNICKFSNSNKNLLECVETRVMPGIFSRMRGSSNGFYYNNEYWFVTHMVSFSKPRYYYHFIVILDSNLNLLRYSAPFNFEGEAIEYCLSIVVEVDRVLMNYSTWDKSTRIGIYDKSYIDSVVSYYV